MKPYSYWLLLKEDTEPQKSKWPLNHTDWEDHLELHEPDRREGEHHHDFASRHRDQMVQSLPKDPTIFVDFDDTLAKVDKDIKEGWKTVVDSGHKRWSVIARPDAFDFLPKLQKLGKVYVISDWHTDFTEEMLRITGLLSLVDGVFGYDSWNNIPRSSNAVLIDDEPAVHIRQKFIATGLRHIHDGYSKNDHRHVRVHSFDGDQGDKHSLLSVLPDVEGLLTGW